MSMYKQDGVDVEAGDSFSDFAGNICATTYKNSPYVTVKDMSRGHFRGLRSWSLHSLPKDCTTTGAADGIGTAVIAIDATMTHCNAPQFLVAMCAGDLTRKGALPLIFFNLLDTSSLGELGSRTNRAFRTMMASLGEITKNLKLVLMGGETAELGVCVGSDNPNATTKFNWGGFCIGVCHPDKMILGDELEDGQVLIALRDHFRSNGWSSIRKAFVKRFGNEWFTNDEALKYMYQAVIPPTLYDNLLASANGWYQPNFEPLVRLKIIAHVTGDSLPSKLGEDLLFPRGLSAVLDDLWEPPEIMKQVAEWRGGSDREIMETWNGGQGVVVAVDEKDAGPFISLAKSYGIQAKKAGRILKEDKPTLVIHSKFSGEVLPYGPKGSS